MSTDRELLELAAKAYQNPMVSYVGGPYGGWHRVIGHNHEMDCDVSVLWNPLIDDGDALRLAVKLELDIVFLNGDTIVLTASQGGGDPNERTRSAIVRAAAEIGRRMP